MSADRELLELAAKAAGYPQEWKGAVKIMVDAPIYERDWNPLTDDGDALRLAVKLRIGTDCFVDAKLDEYACAWVNHRDVPVFRRAYEPYGTDPLAATRRAIVRTAAEVGLAMP